MKNKSIIAKLLSEEDIFVVNKQTQTAAFNVETRELILPIWKEEMSNEVADLFVCHEIGHALYTSKDMLTKMIDRKLDKSYVNVIEDARIEKMVQEKYLGTKSVFKKGYNELSTKDFFGTKGKNLLDFNLIDRINLHFKGMNNVPFSDIEEEWVDKIAKVKTEDEVLDLAQDLMDFINDNKDSQGKEQEQESQSSVGSNEGEGETLEDLRNDAKKIEDTDDTQSSGSNDEGDEGEEEVETQGSSSQDTDEEEKTEAGQDASSGFQGGSEYKHSAKTDLNFNNKMEESRDLDAKDKFYSRIPKVKLENVIISNKEIMEICRKNYGNETIGSGEAKFYNATKQEAEKFQQDSKKVISYMVKEFEMKKAADQYARASTSKTGVLDMGALHTYKFNEDLFAKVTTLPGATNHGMVMFLDWSGSMHPNLTQTLKQLYNLVWFCDRVKIPYVVYAFSDQWEKQGYTTYNGTVDSKIQDGSKSSDMCIEDIRLLEMFSSNMSKKETAEMMHYTHMMGEYYVGYRDWRKDGYPIRVSTKMSLGGTPLNHAIVVAMDLLPKFKKDTGVQKVNTVFLTDGESHYIHYTCSHQSTNGYSATSVITDPITNKTVFQDKDSSGREVQTTMLLKLLKKRVYGMNILGFFVAGSGKKGIVKRDIICWKMGINEYAETDKLKEYQKELRTKKVLVCKTQGYDEYYILPSVPKVDETEEEGLQVKEGAKTGELKRAFAKFSSSKTLNRQLLNKFIDKVA